MRAPSGRNRKPAPPASASRSAASSVVCAPRHATAARPGSRSLVASRSHVVQHDAEVCRALAQRAHRSGVPGRTDLVPALRVRRCTLPVGCVRRRPAVVRRVVAVPDAVLLAARSSTRPRFSMNRQSRCLSAKQDPWFGADRRRRKGGPAVAWRAPSRVRHIPAQAHAGLPGETESAPRHGLVADGLDHLSRWRHRPIASRMSRVRVPMTRSPANAANRWSSEPRARPCDDCGSRSHARATGRAPAHFCQREPQAMSLSLGWRAAGGSRASQPRRCRDLGPAASAARCLLEYRCHGVHGSGVRADDPGLGEQVDHPKSPTGAIVRCPTRVLGEVTLSPS